MDPIESEEDRKKAISSINTLLDKADKVYKQLIGNKPQLESLLLRVSESASSLDSSSSPIPAPDSMMVAQAAAGAGLGSNTHVNINIQQLAQKYCGESKNLFEELSKIIQKVMATRKELLAFDNNRRPASKQVTQTRDVSSFRKNAASRNAGKCYGCATASVEHCLTLLRALANKPKIRHLLFKQGLIEQLMEHNLRRGSVATRIEVKKLITFLTKDNLEATNHLNRLLCNKIGVALKSQTIYIDLVESVRHEMSLLAYTIQKEDSCWEERLKCVFKLFIMSSKKEKASPSIMECITLPCLKILQGMVRPTVKFRKGKEPGGSKDVSSAAMQQVESTEIVSIDVSKWLENDEEHSFKKWEQRAPKPKVDPTKKEGDPRLKKREGVRELYLTQKYFKKWNDKTFRKNSFPLDILKHSWLKWVLFNPTSRSARQVACSMIDSICTVHERKKNVVDLMTSFLDELSESGEAASDFCTLYQRLIITDEWKYYLAIKVPLWIFDLQ